jgi:hypothetical protein
MKKPLMELKPNECRFPLEFDREVIGHYYFCADTTDRDASYCDRHKKLLTDKPSPRRL